MKITRIETSTAFAISRRAVIYAPADATPGSLALLTDFLRDKGIEAYPGWENGHVLRLANYGSDHDLLELLTTSFKEWQKDHPTAENELVEFDEQLALREISDKGLAQTFNLKEFLKNNSTSLTGLLSLASGMAVMMSTRAKPGALLTAADTRRAAFKKFASANFLMAGAALAVLGQNQSNTRSMAEIVNELDGPLSRDDRMRYLQDNRGIMDNMIAYAKRHPWHVATTLNAVGTISQLSALSPRQDIMETAGALAALTSLALIVGVFPDRSISFPGINSYIDAQSDAELDAKMQELEPFRTPLEGTARTINRVQGHLTRRHMQYAGGVSAVANAGMTLAGLLDNKSKFNKRTLMMMAPLNFSADYLTSVSHTTFSHGFDNVVSHAADYIDQKYGDADMKTIMQEAKIVAKALSMQTEIGFDEFKIEEGILVRLKQYYGHIDLPTYPDMEIDYAKLIASSPFTHGKYTAYVHQQDFQPGQQTGAAVGS
ncbi:MAG: hypothetical protein CMM93_07395 [Rickettsiales bacterium]|nr:hypothetical protein [Rickettsiales bacterium]|tara:strand:- start:54 stop:1517 length:1464 start_codon:yes stop_codon:yes gene_type:complete